MAESKVAERLIDNMRGVRYGEVLPIFLREDGLHAEVYGTQMLNDCPQHLWEKLDAAAIAKEMDAVFVKLNGPRYWVLDGFGLKVAPVEPVFREFGGIMFRRIATLAQRRLCKTIDMQFFAVSFQPRFYLRIICVKTTSLTRNKSLSLVRRAKHRLHTPTVYNVSQM